MVKEGINRNLTPCPFCGNKKVEIVHHTPTLQIMGAKDSWSFRHQCRRRTRETTTLVITGIGYCSAKEAEEGWSRGCRDAKKNC